MEQFDPTKWIEFYKNNCPDETDVSEVINNCMTLEPGVPQFNARLMMLRGYRLTTISDGQKSVVIERDPLRLLFMLIAAENVAKLFEDFEGEGQSRKYVQKFFNQFCAADEKEELANGILDIDKGPALETSIDVLYDVRCKVVHEGIYYDFHFMDQGQPVSSGIETTIRVSMPFERLREIIVRSMYRSIKAKLNNTLNNS